MIDIEDYISYNICTQRFKTFILCASKTETVTSFMDEISLRIPKYLELKKHPYSIYTTNTGTQIICRNARNNVTGIGFESLIIWYDLTHTQKDKIKRDFSPCGCVISIDEKGIMML